MFYNLKVLDFGDFQQLRIYQKVVNYDLKVDDDFLKDYLDRAVVEEDIEDNESNYNLLTDEEKQYNSFKSSISRTVNLIYKYGFSNHWDYFVTFTLRRDLDFDVYNYDVAVKKIRIWLQNQRRKNPDMKSLFVPERHKDGAYHFHGLLADCPNLKLTDSGYGASGRKVLKRTGINYHLPVIYNLDDWHYGFTTCTEVQDTRKVVSYLCKYITKDLIDDVGKRRRFYPSNNLNVPEESEYFIESFDLKDFLDGYADNIDFIKSVVVPECGQKVTYVTINK